jgi:hypothetical protein
MVEFGYVDQIDGHDICMHVKTTPDWYGIEKNLQKPFTVRLMEDYEFNIMRRFLLERQLKYIKLYDSEDYENNVMHKIEDVYVMGEILGNHLVAIQFSEIEEESD